VDVRSSEPKLVQIAARLRSVFLLPPLLCKALDLAHLRG
jgi:hypothetical protein